MKFILFGREEMFAQCHLFSNFQQTLLCIVVPVSARKRQRKVGFGKEVRSVASTVVRKLLAEVRVGGLGKR